MLEWCYPLKITVIVRNYYSRTLSQIKYHVFMIMARGLL